MSKQERILTEEELNKVANLINDLHRGRFITDKLHCEVENVIVSHSSLLTANAALSFENMRLKAIEEHAIKRIKAETAGNERLDKQVEELQTDLAAAKGNALLWRDKATIHQREIEELQRELAAEKEASEIWRRRLIKKGVETE